MDEKRLILKKGEKAAKLSTVVLLIISILKALVSFISGSVVLLASTIDSFSDVLATTAVWVGLRIAKKKPTEKFPYGYYKAETFAVLVVSLIIIFSAVLILIESFWKIFESQVISFSNIALAITVVSAVVYYLVAKYKTRIGRQIGSQALLSDGLHSMIDVYASALVFIGIFLNTIGFPVGEALIGLFIGAYVLVRGVLYGKDAALILMDISPNPQIVKQMKKIAEEVPGVKGTHDVRLRKAGPVLFGEIHIELQKGLSIERAHVLSEEIEERIKERFKDIEVITVNIGIAHQKKLRMAVPIVADKGLESLVSLHFGNSRYFAFLDIEEGQITGFRVKENKGAKQSHKKGIIAANLLIEEKVDVVLAGSIGEGPFHILGDNLLRMYYLSKAMEIQDAIRFFNQNMLERIDKPTEK